MGLCDAGYVDDASRLAGKRPAGAPCRFDLSSDLCVAVAIQRDRREVVLHWGKSLQARIDTSEGTTSTTYAALATPGPSVTVPRAGDYNIRSGALISLSTGAGLRRITPTTWVRRVRSMLTLPRSAPRARQVTRSQDPFQQRRRARRRVSPPPRHSRRSTAFRGPPRARSPTAGLK
jgi:hypothetical protein